jgi:hypothetical protein
MAIYKTSIHTMQKVFAITVTRGKIEVESVIYAVASIAQSVMSIAQPIAQQHRRLYIEYHLRNCRQQRMIREPSQHRRNRRIRTCPS